MYDIIKKFFLVIFLNLNLSYFVGFVCVCVCLIYNYWLEFNIYIYLKISKDFLLGKNIYVYYVYIIYYNS